MPEVSVVVNEQLRYFYCSRWLEETQADTPVQPHFWKVIKKDFGPDMPVTLADVQDGPQMRRMGGSAF